MLGWTRTRITQCRYQKHCSYGIIHTQKYRKAPMTNSRSSLTDFPVDVWSSGDWLPRHYYVSSCMSPSHIEYPCCSTARSNHCQSRAFVTFCSAQNGQAMAKTKWITGWHISSMRPHYAPCGVVAIDRDGAASHRCPELPWRPAPPNLENCKVSVLDA